MARPQRKYVYKEIIHDVKVEGVKLPALSVFFTADHELLVLPLLYAHHLARHGFVYEEIIKNGNPTGRYYHNYLSDRSILNYISHLHGFLDAIEEYSFELKKPNLPSATNLHLVNNKLVNRYLNHYLPPKMGSFASLEAHRTGLQAFFNYLKRFGFHDGLNVTLSKSARDRLGDRSYKNKEGVVQYISREFRRLLLRECSTDRDRLILRVAFEMGLRASETRCLVLVDQIVARHSHKGLLALFEELADLNKKSFEFWLNGSLGTKGAKSRRAVISRDLLESIKRYYDNERFNINSLRGFEDCNHLFVSYSDGKPLSPRYPTKLFAKLRNKIEHLDKYLSYHDLRHTFATELYATLIENKHGVRSQERALTIVADRLGHSYVSSTEKYVHLFEHMKAIEESDSV